ncbi:hypothetical protein BDV28DRAFT_39423 [Aspergillus coremiiformis]|uniref:rRNA adenine N(6)-methyltransferase n=1 Tax=Aspergillus coremiiformis TaxID=138285 RepID=A0A5N6Z374_9EURO|nr:hypothetical protein BDV28DRAFT_39423 [Aspergillus coremiiformis]
MRPNRWTPVPHFPLTQVLTKSASLGYRKACQNSIIVSEKLCDDILQRLSPFLLRKPAVDILDLWPAGGLWSSKINEFLNPRRHVLIEPELESFKSLLQPLAQSRSCYELVSMDLYSITDWKFLLSTYFPEQGPSSTDNSGFLPKNDTLLILANPPPTVSKRNHYNPARWWSIFMENCMHQSGLHAYGSVRMIATLPVTDAQQVLPRSMKERKRPALLTENVALHAFEVAAPTDPSLWATLKGWELVTDNVSWVAQKAAKQGITTPHGRELPPIPMAPDSPNHGKIPIPYSPRSFTELHKRLLKQINSSDQGSTRNPTRSRALTQLNKDNRDSYKRQALTDKIIEIDELTKTLSRSAADPTMDSTALKPILDKIETAQSVVAQELSDTHYEVIKETPLSVDCSRAALHTGNFDDAVLLWDRRPFEPLLIHPEEQFPRQSEKSVFYFEADSNPTALRKLSQLDLPERNGPFRLFEAYSFTMHSRTTMTVAELLETIFPGRPINDIVKAVPALAVFAAKTLKPAFDTLPKTLHGPPGATNNDQKLDPVASYQENLDYDLSAIRARVLPCSTLWDIFVEYQKSDSKLSMVQLNRALGGTLTSFRTGEYILPEKRYH